MNNKSHEKINPCNNNTIQNFSPGQIFLLGILVCAIMTNAAQFFAIEEGINFINYSVFKGYGTHDLHEISLQFAGPTPKSRFNPYLALSKIAPKAEIIIPVDCTLIEERLYGLGRAGSVKRVNYDAEKIFTEFEIFKYELEILGGVEDRDQGVVAISMAENIPQTLIVFRNNDIWQLVDASLLPDEAIKEVY